MIDRSILPQAVVRLRKRRELHSFLAQEFAKVEDAFTKFPPVIEQANPGHMTTPNDGWIEWKGGDQPVADHVMAFLRLADGSENSLAVRADCVTWHAYGQEDDIVAYKVAA